MGMCGDGKPGRCSAPGTDLLDVNVGLCSFRSACCCLPPSCCPAPARSEQHLSWPPPSRGAAAEGVQETWWVHGLVPPALNPLGDVS